MSFTSFSIFHLGSSIKCISKSSVNRLPVFISYTPKQLCQLDDSSSKFPFPALPSHFLYFTTYNLLFKEFYTKKEASLKRLLSTFTSPQTANPHAALIWRCFIHPSTPHTSFYLLRLFAMHPSLFQVKDSCFSSVFLC